MRYKLVLRNTALCRKSLEFLNFFLKKIWGCLSWCNKRLNCLSWCSRILRTICNPLTTKDLYVIVYIMNEYIHTLKTNWCYVTPLYRIKYYGCKEYKLSNKTSIQILHSTLCASRIRYEFICKRIIQ